MIAFEFTAQVTDSKIEIPETHRGQITGTVRVIVLTPEITDQADMIERLLANPLQIEEFTPLTRDEANERH